MTKDRFDLCNNNKLVHLSIDDVGASLGWLCKNNPRHIWDMRFFNKLREFNTKYGAEFTLYSFYDIGGCRSINDIPQGYTDDFSMCAGWLKFGFHSRNSERFENDDHYKNAYELMQASNSTAWNGQNRCSAFTLLESNKGAKMFFASGRC